MISEIRHQYQLVEGVILHENEGSFELDLGNNRHQLWVLQHLGHLEIKEHEIYYQINRGIRQRKKTEYPVRKMRQRFKTTHELLHFFFIHRYDLHWLKISFTNGWKLEELPYVSFIFHTNNLTERNLLLELFFGVAGIPLQAIQTLKLGSSYYVSMNHKGPFVQEYIPAKDEPARILHIEDYKPFCNIERIDFEPDIDFPF